MTGYGKATAIFGEKKINVEIKSLNSKAMDLSLSLIHISVRQGEVNHFQEGMP